MAITKLMHINPGKKGGNTHLKNSLQYILNPQKTENRYLVGGNSGNDPEEVLRVMMDTKMEWGKEDKRQGYHFVLSFKPDEVNKEDAFLIVRDFCEEYLGHEYDYVFAIHTDQSHLHGHIIFNSVNRITGYKYRYEKGDWEKFIQPVTDRICEKYGISRLEFDQDRKAGRSYAEHNAEKKGRPTWTKIIQADIDFAVSRSRSWEEFLVQMKQLGYRIREGKHTSFIPPGAKKGRRDITLGEGYRKEDIRKRISQETLRAEPVKILSSRLEQSYEKGLEKYLTVTLTRYQIQRVTLFYRAGHYLEEKNPYAVSDRDIRKHAIHIQKLYEECRYVLEHDIKDLDGLKSRMEGLKEREAELKKRKGDRKQDPEKEQERKALLREIRKERRMAERMIEEDEKRRMPEKEKTREPKRR